VLVSLLHIIQEYTDGLFQSFASLISLCCQKCTTKNFCLLTTD